MSPTFIEFDLTHDNARPPSPCIGFCQVHTLTGLCCGCQRNIDEIMCWGQATDAQKRQIWQHIRLRRDAAKRHDAGSSQSRTR